MAIRVLVADDHEVVRAGVTHMLEDADIKVVGEASTGTQAIEQTLKTHPDVVLLDIRMPEADGLTALEAISDKSPETKVVMFSSFDNPTYVARAAALGAAGYILKGSTKEEIVTAINMAAKGEKSETGLMARMKDQLGRRRASDDEEVPLTNRELQVLRHVAMGLSNREIGRSLGISIETVKEHVQNILRKLEANDRTQAAVWAVKKGLVN